MGPAKFLHMQDIIVRYGRIFVVLGIVAMAAQYADQIFSYFHQGAEGELLSIFFVVAMIFALSFAIFYLSTGTSLPSFVVAMFFGLAAQPILKPVVESEAVLASLVGFGATLILFGGGLETPFINFRRLLWRILSLSFPGLLLTAFLFSTFISSAAPVFGLDISLTVALLLGAVLASTDPAAIIPILKNLRFKNSDTRDIIISESAVTDVTGTMLTVGLLTAMAAGLSQISVAGGYASVFSSVIGTLLIKQISFGVIFGFLGYALLEVLTKFKYSHDREYEVDSAFFLFIPVIIFTLAIALGGSGYLAAFIAGLLFSLTEPLHETERFFNHIIDGFFKPTIFLLLGALVDLHSMIDYAAIGIVASLVFMFIIRPVCVFLFLGPFSLLKRGSFSWRELLFVSFVRETGAIPAVLLVTIVSSGLSGIDGLLPIGMWVILLTLLLEPPLTPWLAKYLGVARPIEDSEDLNIESSGSAVVLATRGYTWTTRLPKVVEWATQHGVEQVLLLLCLEYKYDEDVAHGIELSAHEKFEAINQSLKAQGQPTLQFTFVSRTGFLEQNIRDLSRKQADVIAIFVGRKMLDFRLKEIKKMKVPIYFME